MSHLRYFIFPISGKLRILIRQLIVLVVHGISEFRKFNEENNRRTVERNYLRAEKSLRNQGTDKVLASVNPQDWIFVCDVDEILDGQTPQTKKFFQDLTRNSGSYPSVVRLKVRQRLWDFDNLNVHANLSRVIIKAGLLLTERVQLGQVRISRTDGWWPKLALEGIHEYSSCLSKDGLSRKFHTYVHLADSEESLATALSCNTTLSYGAPPLYLVKLDVSIDHQPRFIKENLELLKTNNVACNFELNRKGIFAERVEYIE